MSRHQEHYGVTDAEPFALVDYTNSHHGFAMFSFYGPVNPNWGYRGCGCQAIPNDQVPANIKAVLEQKRYRLFDQRTGKEITRH